jgi:branched-chain amino acid transport system permease protein
MLGGGVAALAGVALAFWLTVVGSTVFSLDQTVLAWAMLIIGGRGNNFGALVGALFVQAIYTGTRFLPAFGPFSGEDFALLRIFLIGFIFVVVLIFRVDGAFPERRVRHNRKQGVWRSKVGHASVG